MSSADARTVLITGASAGIGKALAHVFAAHGHDLVLVARRVELLRELAVELRERHGVRVFDIPLDLTVRRSADELMVAVRQRDLHIDVLVNNAGVAESGAFSEMEGDALHRLVMLNVAGPTQLSRVFLPAMLEAGWGRILNVASVAGFQPVPGLAAYAASKAYVLSLTEAMTEELRGSGVRVTALCPGLTATDMADQIAEIGPAAPELAGLFMASAEDVAKEGYAACMRGEAIRVTGMANRLGTLWSQVQPRWVVRTLGGLVGRQLLARR
ncbi:MAG TPA: SDR family oxidoreductase [Pseudomonadales bacterium]|nr:SDR family oxidoreductase [Pseudomonadales bacterium]